MKKHAISADIVREDTGRDHQHSTSDLTASLTKVIHMPEATPRFVTRLETSDEVHRALRGDVPAPAQPTSAKLRTPVVRPAQRPPVALVCALDDGSTSDGEWLRL